MRYPLLACALAALALAAASPPSEPQHPRDPVAAAHVVGAASLDVEAPASAVEVAPEHATVAVGFLALKPSTVAPTSPEVLAVAPGRDCALQPFQPKDLAVRSLPRLRAPSWRLIGPNGASGVVNVARG